MVLEQVEHREHVRPERRQREHGDSHGRKRRAEQDTPALARCHEHERQHHAGGDLDRHGSDERGAAQLRLAVQDQQRAGDERQRHEHVVVPAADRVDEEQRVEGEEQHRRHRTETEPPGARPDKCRAAERRQPRGRFERPHRARHAERYEHIAEQREQGPIVRGRVQPHRPGEGHRPVAGDGDRAVHVRVHVVERPHPRVRHVVEDVRGEHRRRQGEQCHEDGGPRDRDPSGNPTRTEQHEHVERRHQDDQAIELVEPDPAAVPAMERAGHPARHAVAPRRYEQFRVGRSGGDEP